MSNIGGALPPQSEYWGGWSPPSPPSSYAPDMLFPLGMWPMFSQPLGRLVVLLASPYPWLAPAVIMLSSVYIIM